ncbi:MAG: MFS transporter [gamma proteobacterium symbiont of Ctena orbiculata]|nr:MFS transporter [Candidatus Thiodiazotropha taylori]MBT3060332.1 MFS transporter [Candidatus Thiodiazotropha sp. (ex Lucina pensylvanica)]MBT3064143.1 MFS transporter [Candidatus Thiodiazotropha sp. (ex Lucina pensylvanica)]PUB73311.1 MAG: MFS transporter [gamma proteobacterium symbiont of Ctena orbiculata]PUB79784.1 MAG: MFS transporter [gamma proteobacterium symbiont of Ctena orbiculata]
MHSRIQRLADIKKGEWRAVAWSFLYFFSLLSSYYILRPIRDEMGVIAGVEKLHWLFTATFFAMLLLVPLFGYLTSRLPRRRFLPYVYYFFIGNILIFFLLFESGYSQVFIARVFFVWLSVFNLFVVSVFWSFMTDLFVDEEAKRLFAVIAAGGTIGAITGPLLTTLLVQVIGTSSMLLLSAGLLGLAVFCIHRLIAWQPDQGGQKARHREEDRPLGGAILDGIRLTLTSPYLLGICLLMLLFTLLSTFLYFQQAQIVKEAFADSETRTAVFAAIDLAVNTLTLLLQTLVTARLVKGFGLAVTLALIPLLLVIGFMLLGLNSTLPVLIAVQVMRRAGNYAIMRPAREMLYVVLSREEKYKAKNFIDTLVYRGGDAVSSWIYAGFRAIGLSLSAIAWIAVPIALAWAWIAFQLGRRQAILAKRSYSQAGGDGHENLGKTD